MKPYGYVRKDSEGLFIYGEHQFENTMGAELMPVYLHTKEWVGLTDEERSKLVTLHHGWNEYGQAIEQALKEKNT